MKPFTKKVVLEDGREFYGWGFGSDCEAIAKIVVNTSMVGYQEVMSDPSYRGQTVVMTYPLIGNYGMADDDYENKSPQLSALVVAEYNDLPSNFRYTKTLSEVLVEQGIPGLWGIDTRALARAVRGRGTQKCIVTDAATPRDEAVGRLETYAPPHDLVARVSCPKRWMSRVANRRSDVVVVDCGVRNSLVRLLNGAGCNVTVVPSSASEEQIMAFRPDGVVFSSGPGDPHDAGLVIALARKLLGRMPLLGVGLGHQIVALACGAEVVRMAQGHHGSNRPVRNLQTGQIEITTQNHDHAVLAESLAAGRLTPTFTDELDGAVEGTESCADGVFTMQYYPESTALQSTESPFTKFINHMENHTNG